MRSYRDWRCTVCMLGIILFGGCGDRTVVWFEGDGSDHVGSGDENGAAVQAKGGELELVVDGKSRIFSLGAKVALVEDFPCVPSNWISMAPAELMNGEISEHDARARVGQTLLLQNWRNAGTLLTFSALEAEVPYTVIAAVTELEHVIGYKCLDGLVLTQAAIDQGRALSAHLHLSSAWPPSLRRTLELTTELPSTTVALHKTAEHFHRLSDGIAEPWGYILDEMLAHADDALSAALRLHRGALVERLSRSVDGQNARLALTGVGNFLVSIEDVQLHSLLALPDLPAAGTDDQRSEVTASHSFNKFSVSVKIGSGSLRRYDYIDHYEEATQEGELPESSAPPQLEATTTVTISKDTRRMTIGAHAIDVPIGSAIVYRTILEQLGTTHIDRVLRDLFDCDRMNEQLESLALDTPAPGAVAACQDVVDRQIAQIEDDLRRDLRDLQPAITFEGAADVRFEFLPDGHLIIDKLTNGSWREIGGFDGTQI